MRKRNNMYTSYLTCEKCEKIFPIMRSKGYMRERGHIKDMWCPFCKEESKFIERKGEII